MGLFQCVDEFLPEGRWDEGLVHLALSRTRARILFRVRFHGHYRQVRVLSGEITRPRVYAGRPGDVDLREDEDRALPREVRGREVRRERRRVVQ